MPDILVIEDDPTQRSEIQAALLRAGHRVDGASNGNDGLVRLREKRYHLLLTDLMMDQGTGFEVLEWVRDNAPGLPVVICSSYAKTENLMTFLNAPFFRILRKPFQEEELVEQVRALLASL